MNDKVKALFKAQPWTLATCGSEPNAVPVLFKDVCDDGTLTVGDVFLDTTLKNISSNGMIAVSAFDPATLEGYQIKGVARHVASGGVVEAYKKAVAEAFGSSASAKGALIITPKSVVVTTPGPDNKKTL